MVGYTSTGGLPYDRATPHRIHGGVTSFTRLMRLHLSAFSHQSAILPAPGCCIHRESSSVHVDAQMAHRTRLPLQRIHITDPSRHLTSPRTGASQTGRSVTYTFERSTRLRDNVGSQNGTVSDPAEGIRNHTGKEGTPSRRHQKEVWPTRRLVRSLKACNCSPRQLVSPPSSLPMQPRRHQPRLIPLPPPKLRATSHARSALPYGSTRTSG